MTDINWTTLPTPEDDGAMAHLVGTKLPALPLPATDGSIIDLSALPGLTIVFIYPMTARPGVALPDGWDEIPGARGCTPQSCAFRDQYAELRAAGVSQVFGVSTQDGEWQGEAAERLHLPYLLLSDASLKFADALSLPRFEAEGQTLLKRASLAIRDGVIEDVIYPVFPPDRNADLVLEWVQS